MIKLFEQFNNEQEIHDICKKYNIENYTINPDGFIDVDDGVDLSGKDLIKIPLKFNKVNGWFDCSYNQLTSLEGCPSYVGISFNCSYNCLTTLENSPNEVGKSFCCYSNRLTSLEGFPQKVGNYTHCCPNFYLESINGYTGDYKKLLLNNNKKYLIRKHKLNLINNIIKQ